MIGRESQIENFDSYSPFSSEVALVDHFVSSKVFSESNPKENLNIDPIFEFDCAHGIADVVYYSLRENWETYNRIAHVPPSWAYALRALPYRKKFDESGFAKWCGVSNGTARKILSLYEDLEFIHPATTKNEWFKVRQPRQLVSSIHAIEAKLRDWKKALYQAIRYKSFAHHSWVLMDAAFIKPALMNLEKFQNREIGLASVGSDGKFEVHCVSSKRQPKSDIYFWQANALIGSELLEQMH